MGQERPPTEQVLDLFLYAPVGLLLGGPKPLPRAVAKGRQCVESHVNFARLVGKFAVQRGTHHARLRVARLLDQPAPPAPIRPQRPAAPAHEPHAEATDTHPVDEVIRVRHEPADLAIPEYDALAASQVVPRLAGLTATELEAVRVYEADRRRRRTILARIDQLQGR